MRPGFLAFCLSGFLVAVPGVLAAQDAPPASEPGAIVIYRGGSIFGAALGCPIRYRGVELVELGRNKYAEWRVPAGRYVLVNNTASVEVTVEPGDTSFVRCAIKPGFMTGRSDLQIVDRETFQRQGGLGMERKPVSIAAAPAANRPVSPPAVPAPPVEATAPAPAKAPAPALRGNNGIRCETCP